MVSRLLLDPCCLLKLPFALLLEGPGVPFKLLLVGIVLPFGVLLKRSLEKASGMAVRLSGDPALVNELDLRGSVEWPYTIVTISIKGITGHHEIALHREHGCTSSRH